MKKKNNHRHILATPIDVLFFVDTISVLFFSDVLLFHFKPTKGPNFKTHLRFIAHCMNGKRSVFFVF